MAALGSLRKKIGLHPRVAQSLNSTPYGDDWLLPPHVPRQ